MTDKPMLKGLSSAKSRPATAFDPKQNNPHYTKPPEPAVYKQSRRLHRKQAANYLGMSLSWLDKARLNGNGPIFISIGGRVVYDLKDLEDFLQSNRHASTSEQY